MSEEAARPLFQQLMTAVEYCHSLGIANRDVKVSLPGAASSFRPHTTFWCFVANRARPQRTINARSIITHDMGSVRADAQ